jgi:ABC-type lipoprotein export system ATPase subunit
MLKLENISKYYYSSSNVTCALRKINIEFKCGEFVAITGESGSGKTTLLNVISGLDSYEDGELFYDDKQTSYFDAEDWEKYRKEEIAFIFQHYNLIDSYSVLENVMLSYTIDGVPRKVALEKAKAILKSDYDTIEQVALSVGYNSIYHFSRMFKQYTGINPSEYAKASRQ